jgi:cellobiose-specific phosphotransferase system component IIA
MSAYPLGSLLMVREFREKAAAAAVTAAKNKVEEAKELIVQRERELVEYIEWRKCEEKRLFEEIKLKEIEYTGLEDHQTDVQQLRQKEGDYRDRIEQAKAALEEAKKNLEEAKQAHANSVQEKRKIEEHKEIWLEEQKKLEAMAEDLEMEEFMGKPSLEEEDEFVNQ